jgi:hypothetical protein
MSRRRTTPAFLPLTTTETPERLPPAGATQQLRAATCGENGLTLWLAARQSVVESRALADYPVTTS